VPAICNAYLPNFFAIFLPVFVNKGDAATVAPVVIGFLSTKDLSSSTGCTPIELSSPAVSG
jgi:hypothetical protein